MPDDRPARTRGRPPLHASTLRKSAPVLVRLTEIEFDAADRHARRQRESMQETIRRGLRRLLDDERGR